MTVAQILAALKQHGVALSGLANDSRKVVAGDVFLAYPGELVDGRDYIADALARGAVAIVYEAVDARIDAFPVPAVAVPDLRNLAAALAAAVYGEPSHKLWLAGVTGTNGKTSVSQWLAQCFEHLGGRCAVIGTLGNGYPGALMASPNTTPDALVLQKALAGFVAEGAAACAMEVSSIGIEEGRVDATQFAVAVFTNFTRDHLDYHGSMEAYAAAKARLFAWPGLGAAVINLDDRFGLKLVREINGRIPVIGYSLNVVRVPVDELVLDELLLITQLEMTDAGVSFRLNDVTVSAPVVGRFNVSNLLAVIGALRAAHVTLADATAACAHLRPPPGRMQTLNAAGKPLVVVDYAHTPDAMEKVLATLREVALARGGRLLCLFGCGGDRDAGKRPMMGAVAERCSDRVMLTSDNPRHEDPLHILDEIRDGMQHLPEIVPDRAEAITRVLGEAAAADVVLIAGKGHEDYQEIKGERFHFSDLEAAAAALDKWQEGAC